MRKQVRYVDVFTLIVIRSWGLSGWMPLAGGGLAFRSSHQHPAAASRTLLSPSLSTTLVRADGTECLVLRCLAYPLFKLIEQDPLAGKKLPSRQRNVAPERAIGFRKALRVPDFGAIP